MADYIREHYPESTIELIGGGRGDFIVTIDGERIWDKRGRGEGFPANDVILTEVDRRVG